MEKHALSAPMVRLLVLLVNALVACNYTDMSKHLIVANKSELHL